MVKSTRFNYGTVPLCTSTNSTASFIKKLLFSSTITVCCVMMLLLSSSALGQVVLPPSNISCSSKDLEVKRAILPTLSTNPCACDELRKLQLVIANKTGSGRTAFAMWGTLVRYNANGEPVDRFNVPIPAGQPIGETIFACASNIKKNSEQPYVSDKEIYVTCNQTLKIIDVVMAWTSSAPGEDCNFLKTNPSTINPKCGRVESIVIETGVDGTADVKPATCANNNMGTITVTPYGSVNPPYTIAIGTDSRSVQAGNNTVFSRSPGDYTITITDSKGCIKTLPKVTISSSGSVTANAGQDFAKTCTLNALGKQIGEANDAAFSYSWSPAAGLSATNVSAPTANPTATTTYTVRKTNLATGCYDDDDILVTVDNAEPTFTLCLVQPTLCANSGSVTINASGNGFEYSINGTDWYSSNTFSNLASGSITSIKVKGANGCIATIACADAVSTCDNISKAERPGEEQSNTLKHSRITNGGKVSSIHTLIGDKTKVIAAPNPFTDKVRFTLESSVSGQGSLEIYNTMGQKIHTVYQGHVEAGQQLVKEYNVPLSQRQSLIYIFKVGDQKTTGKLLNW